jgi:hypothetical protein
LFSFYSFIHRLQTAAKFTAHGIGDIGSAMKDGMMNLGSETKDLFGCVTRRLDVLLMNYVVCNGV